MKESLGLDRRTFLRFASSSASLLVTSAAMARLGLSPASAAPAAESLPFVDDYTTNVLVNLSPQTNAAVRILSGMAQLWQTGPTWNTGVPLRSRVLQANLRHVVSVTTHRTDAQSRKAFIYDRQHQSYAVIAGLGPLAEVYRAGAKAVTSITTAPDGTPPGPISDAVPVDAPVGSALGAGSVTSDLGQVALLVNTVRGPFASGNPSKYAYQYPRPWRLNDDSRVVETGGTDDFGYPIYDSDVVVAVQLLRQRSASPTDDGGYISGHTNAFYLAALALAYAIPERFQELLTRAAELSDTRIVAGMHSPLDVIGGRILGTALAAAALADPQNAALKAAARRQATEYLQSRTGTTADTLFDYAHSTGLDADPYADRDANITAFTPRLTYHLPEAGGRPVKAIVPKGAEVLVETRLPYLSVEQRREVLRTTALPSGHVLLDGPEQWGRLNLVAAADGYGTFDHDVDVEMNSNQGGFHAADRWRNDIDGPGGLIKRGTGVLTLSGANCYRGGTWLRAGTLIAGSPDALGRGDVHLLGGTLELAPMRDDRIRLAADFNQSKAAVLELTLRHDGAPALTVARTARLESGSELVINLDVEASPGRGVLIPVIRAGSLRGTFASITVQGGPWRVVPVYSAGGLSVRLLRIVEGVHERSE
jgi:autotransporter-associated beta strand protein